MRGRERSHQTDEHRQIQGWTEIWSLGNIFAPPHQPAPAVPLLTIEQDSIEGAGQVAGEASPRKPTRTATGGGLLGRRSREREEKDNPLTPISLSGQRDFYPNCPALSVLPNTPRVWGPVFKGD